MGEKVVFNKVKKRITMDNLINRCYASSSEEVIEKIDIDLNEIEIIFDPLVELFYNILDKEGRLQ